MKNMKLIMERFNRYEEEVLFEQKINEIQETNEFKLFAEGKIDKEEFKSFLIEAYGEELAEGFLADLGAKLKKLGLGAATIATLLAGAPADVKAAPSSATTQVVASDDDRMQDVARFVSNAQDIRALELSQSGAGATKEDKQALEAAETKMKEFLDRQGLSDTVQKKLLELSKSGEIRLAKELFERALERKVTSTKPERKGGEEQSRARYKLQILATASGDNGFDAGLIEKALENNEITDEQASQLAPLAGKANQARAVEKILGL
jgi:hypothetical protein